MRDTDSGAGKSRAHPDNGALGAPVRDRRGRAGERIIITGTGRAGTTALVQLFAALGFDTGYTADEMAAGIDPIARAGLEKPMTGPRAPYVAKSPWYADALQAALDAGTVRLFAAILPMRTLFAAAESRRHVYTQAQAQGRDPDTQPGTLWKTDRPEGQEAQLAMQYYKALYPLVQHEVPVFMLDFPRFVTDPVYLHARLRWLWDIHGVGYDELARAHAQVMRPDSVNRFAAP